MHKTSDTLDGDSGLDTRGLFSLCKPTQVIAKELLYTTDHKRQADRSWLGQCLRRGVASGAGVRHGEALGAPRPGTVACIFQKAESGPLA